MLVLSRKPGQSLIIGEDVRVKIVEVRGQQVRIGIEAPSRVSVVREELHRAVAAANRQSVRVKENAISAIASKLRKDREKEPPVDEDEVSGEVL